MKITNWKTCLEVVKSLFLSLNESFVIISHSEKKKHFSKGFFSPSEQYHLLSVIPKLKIP